jgi:hypothetical protein
MVGVLVAASATTLVAIAARSQIVAAFGLIAVLGAPPVLGAEPDGFTLAYVIVTLAGVAVISLWQTWPWLPPLAFLLSAPQVHTWIESGPEPLLGASALLGFWALMAIAAGGEAFRSRRSELSLTATPLLTATGAFTVYEAFALIGEPTQQAAFLIVLAVLHGAMAAFFMSRRGTLDPFGLLSGAFGVAIASMAVPLLFGATVTVVVWAGEAAALAVLAGRRAHGPSLMASFVLFAIAGSRLALEAYEYVGSWLAPRLVIGPVDTLVLGLTFFLLAAAVIIVAVPVRSFRLPIVGMAAIACIPVVFVELESVAAVTAWTAIAVGAIGARRWLSLLPERGIHWQLGPALEWLRPTRDLAPETVLLPVGAACIAAAAAFVATALLTLEQWGRPDIPFTDEAGIAALIVAVGCVAAGLMSGGANIRRGVIAGGVVVGVAAFFQMPFEWVVVLWAALAAGAFLCYRSDQSGTVSYLVAAAGAIAAVTAGALTLAPPSRLMVDDWGVEPHPLLISDASLVLAALAAALAAGWWLHRRASWADAALGAAGVVALYLLSVAIVDVFAGEAHGLGYRSWDRLDELGKEAQVALSILWTVTGVIVLGAGLLLCSGVLRLAGLLVLALATAKVFLVDLASLDVAYRVITLIVLGLLLVASAFAWTRLKPAADAATPDETTRTPTDDAPHDVPLRP